jgi:hypothetical protein
LVGEYWMKKGVVAGVRLFIQASAFS